MRKFHRFLVFSVAVLILYLVYRYSFQVDSDGNYLFLKPLESSGDGSGFLTLLPSSEVDHRKPDANRLVNLTDFHFRIVNDVCKENGSYSELLGLLFRIVDEVRLGNDFVLCPC